MATYDVSLRGLCCEGKNPAEAVADFISSVAGDGAYDFEYEVIDRATGQTFYVSPSRDGDSHVEYAPEV